MIRRAGVGGLSRRRRPRAAAVVAGDPARDGPRGARSRAAGRRGARAPTARSRPSSRAFAHRDDVTSTPVEELLRRGRELELPARASGRVVARAYNHTTAVTAAEPGGLAVSMLVSVFDAFGCGTYVPEGGFFLNDRMLGFSRDPESPNAPAPGKRPVHTLSPALFERDGRAVAIATPGADGQVQVLLQLLQALVDEDEDPARALERGRWRAVGGPPPARGRARRELGPALAALGHAVDVTSTGDGLFGSVCIAQADPEAGRRDRLGGSAPRVVGRGVVSRSSRRSSSWPSLVGLAVVYNRLVRDRNRARHTWADIDALLVRRARGDPAPRRHRRRARFDHERETLQEVAAGPRRASRPPAAGRPRSTAAAERRLGVAGAAAGGGRRGVPGAAGRRPRPPT